MNSSSPAARAAEAATPSTSRSPSDTAGADELDAGLGDLLLAARALVPAPEHRALVTEACWNRELGETRRDHARDLRRHVRTEHDDAPGLRLDEAQHFVLAERAQPSSSTDAYSKIGTVTSS